MRRSSEMDVGGEGDVCFPRVKWLQVILCASIMMYVDVISRGLV